jgi:hypothetical protein
VAVLEGGQAAPTPGTSIATVASAPVSPVASTAGPSASRPLGPYPDVAEAAIMASLPAQLTTSCRRGATANDARLAGFDGTYHTSESVHFPATDWPVTPKVLAGITCQLATGADRLYVAEPVTPSDLVSSGVAAGDEYISRLTGRWSIPLGSCATEAKAYQRWSGPRGTGLLACMRSYQGRPWIYFSFGGGRYLGFATRDDAGGYDALYAWWEQLKTFLP